MLSRFVIILKGNSRKTVYIFTALKRYRRPESVSIESVEMPAAVATLNRFIRHPPTAALEFVGFSVERKKQKTRVCPLWDLPQFAEIPASGESQLHNIRAVYRWLTVETLRAFGAVVTASYIHTQEIRAIKRPVMMMQHPKYWEGATLESKQTLFKTNSQCRACQGRSGLCCVGWQNESLKWSFSPAGAPSLSRRHPDVWVSSSSVADRQCTPLVMGLCDTASRPWCSICSAEALITMKALRFGNYLRLFETYMRWRLYVLVLHERWIKGEMK